MSRRRRRSFNSRPCEGATRDPRGLDGGWDGFNSRPCEGATTLDMVLDYAVKVSIHAPVKGRLVNNQWGLIEEMFQFTPL